MLDLPSFFCAPNIENPRETKFKSFDADSMGEIAISGKSGPFWRLNRHRTAGVYLSTFLGSITAVYWNQVHRIACKIQPQRDFQILNGEILVLVFLCRYNLKKHYYFYLTYLNKAVSRCIFLNYSYFFNNEIIEVEAILQIFILIGIPVYYRLNS